MRTYLLCKRLMDIVLASSLVVLLLPLFFFVALGVKFSSKGPLFFRQKRVGYKGQQFSIFKFRTMHVIFAPIWSDPKLGRWCICIGGLLRRLKIDELPQVVNIISGDMSFIGPRPCLPETFKDMPSAKKQMRPGLTGIAQINGNTTLSWEERWDYDLIYINTYGFWLDLFIMMRT